MSTAEGVPAGEELQRHARWIGRLAHALLRDENAAEDLVQDAWLAALTRPPAEGKLRPWLRQVVHNFARQHHRGSARRAERELIARPPSEPEAPDAFVLRLEAEQRLTSELAALEGEFRSVLMLRYYEDLEPAEIAARLGLPGGTVRWRLMRGLALLRERLDRAHGGDRRAWSLALVPLARLDCAVAAATAVVLPGVVLMNVLKLSAAAVAVLGLAFGLSMSGLLPESLSLAHRERPLEVEFRPLELAPLDTPALAKATEPVPDPERIAIAAEPGSERASAAAPETTTIDARFFGGGRALSAARLVVVLDGARREALSSGSDGLASCTFPLSEPRALVRVELFAFGYASEARSAVCERGGTTHLGRIDLAPGGAVSGRIVDERGVGLAHCRVTLGSLEVPFSELEAARLSPARDGIPSCTSDADGRFRLLGVAAGMLRLWGHGDGRKAGYTPPLEVRAGQESTGVELVLEPLAPENRVHGIVLDPAGNPVPEALIAYRHATDGGNSVRSGESKADRGGRFEYLLPADARSWLRATDPAGRWSPGSLADVANGARELVLRLREAREVELVVRGRSQGALPSFAVELLGIDDSADLKDMAEELGPEQAAEVVAQYAPRLGGLARGEHADGRARLALPDQPFFLRVLAPAHRVFQLGPLEPARVAATLECTLEPVPGLSGFVLRGGAPVPLVRVELRAEVEADTAVVVNGYPQRLHPDVHDEARTDAEGRFVLTARVPGSYVVRATPDAGAPAESGPLALDPALAGPPLQLELRAGGAIEGRVTLRSGADPEGAIVGITRGDGGERTRRVARDGRFRFEALLPGPWRVELRDEEVFGPARSVQSNRGPSVEPFELAANCTVYDGETTFVDVSDAPPGSVLLEGRLTIDGRPAAGWTAWLGPVARLEFDGRGWSTLDAEGRFELRVDAPGEYRLGLRKQGGEREEQYLFDDVTLGGSDAPWERELRTGKLRLTGLELWDGEGPPRAVHYWKGPGRLFGLAVPVGSKGEHSIDVPAGPAELRAPDESQDPESWRVLRTIDVPRGAELRVELRAEELDER
jgi:RNA polymerase sigma-70 factor (ECF subfamily)